MKKIRKTKLVLNKRPKIFDKKLNNDNNELLKFNNINQTGITQHYSPANKEWLNSIYTYNQNSMKNLPIYNDILNKILDSYFNLKKDKVRPRKKRFFIRKQRASVKKIFTSKAEVRHTNDKVVVTLYVYNEEKRFLEKKLKQFNDKINFIVRKSIFNKVLRDFYTSNYKNQIIKNLTNKTVHTSQVFKYILMPLINNMTRLIEINFFRTLNNKILSKNLSFLNFYSNKRYVISLMKSLAWEKLYRYRRFISKKLNFNKEKFSNKSLEKLGGLINKMYDKEVEFNFINLKNLHFNSDIFTKIIALKLRNRKNKLLKVLNRSLRLIRLPRINSINFKYGNGKPTIYFRKNSNIVYNDNLNKILHDNFYYQENDNKHTLLDGFILNSLKYKSISGVRIEAKGRLTRRLTASKSIFKVRWKGTLKNIYSSYRGLSSVMLRGHLKSNVQYSFTKAKTRNGAFGIKGWVSGS